MIKEKYQGKIKKIKEYKKFIKEKMIKIRNDEGKLQTQRIIIEKDQEILQQQKKMIKQINEDNRKKIEIVKNTLNEVKKNANFIIKPIIASKNITQKKKNEESIVLKPRRNEYKHDIDYEIQLIQQDINNLENSMHNNPNKSDSIQTKIDRLKTKQSNLKSKRVINASLERSNSASSKIHSFDKEKTISLLKSAQTKQTNENRILSNSNTINILNSKKPPLQFPIKFNEKMTESPDEFQKYLKLRENRLTEKEEDLIKRENMLLNN